MNMNINKVPVFELVFSDNPEKTYVDVIALLEDNVDPAIMIDWVKFSNQEPMSIKPEITSEEKRRVMTPVLLPNQYIKKYNIPNEKGQVPIPQIEPNSEYYISINADNIEKALQRFQRMHNSKNNFNLNHNPNDVISNEKINVFETWLTTNKNDKSKDFGFNLPEGTWMITLQVYDEELWQRIKAGEITAISMQGMFSYGKVIDEVTSTGFAKSEPNAETNVESNADNAEVILHKLKELLS